MIYLNANTKFIGGQFKVKDIDKHFKEIKEFCEKLQNNEVEK